MKKRSAGYPRTRGVSSRLWIPIAATAVLIAVAGAVFATSGDDRSASGASDKPEGVRYVAWDGETATTAAFVGKPLVVNFWASWCASCLAEIPRFVDVYERHKSEVDFLGLNLQDDPDAAEKLAKDLGITYALGRDPEGQAFQKFGGIAMPTTVLIDSEGNVTKRLDGEVSAEQLEADLMRLIEESD